MYNCGKAAAGDAAEGGQACILSKIRDIAEILSFAIDHTCLFGIL